MRSLEDSWVFRRVGEFLSAGTEEYPAVQLGALVHAKQEFEAEFGTAAPSNLLEEIVRIAVQTVAAAGDTTMLEWIDYDLSDINTWVQEQLNQLHGMAAARGWPLGQATLLKDSWDMLKPAYRHKLATAILWRRVLEKDPGFGSSEQAKALMASKESQNGK